MNKANKTTRLLVTLLVMVTVTTPLLIAITLNNTANRSAVTTSGQSVRMEKTPSVKLTEKWTYSPEDGYIESSPAIADVDGDGKLEVLVGSQDYLDAVNGSNGEYVGTYYIGAETADPNFGEEPVIADLYGNGQLEVLIVSNGYLYCDNGTTGAYLWSAGYSSLTGSPAVGDINGMGKLDVVVCDFNGYVFCFNGTTSSQEWQYPEEGIVKSSPTLVDINGDGKLEVLVHRADSFTKNETLECLNSTAEGGFVSPLWTFDMNYLGDTSESSPAVADLDQDGHMEIVVGSLDGNVYCVNSAGAFKWSFQTEGKVAASPTIADIDGDGELEILIGSTSGYLFCLNSTGQPKWNYTAEEAGNIYSSAAVADVDGDGMLEVLVGRNDGCLCCLDRTGGLKWQYNVTGAYSIWSSPAVADIDGDGKLEVVFGSDDGLAYCLSVASAPVVPGAYPWPSIGCREDIRHSGCITDSDNDGLTDNYEITAGTLPNSPDTDGDTMTDYQEFLISSDPLVDTVSPAAITDLAATTSTNNSITLTWTAPGDDGMSGNASGYVVKYSTSGPINSTNWSSATTFSQSWTPAKNGTTETHNVTGLTSHTHYWFAIEAVDDVLNYGEVSVSPGYWTLVTGWQSNPPINLIPGAGNNETTPPGVFDKYGFTMVTTNLTDVVVTSASSQPPGTGAPPNGTASFLYLDITGSQMSGTSGAVIYLFYNRTLVRSLGINESTMELHRWNATTHQWDTILTTVTFLNDTFGVLTAHLNHFSYFAVFGAPPTASGNPAMLLIITGASAAAIIVVVAIVVIKKRSAATSKKAVTMRRRKK